jgi:hypothetical protein
MSPSKKQSALKSKWIAFGSVGLAVAAILVFASPDFDVDTSQMSGTIAPAERFISHQVDNEDLDVQATESTEQGLSAGTMENALENSIDNAMSSQLSNNMSRTDPDSSTACEDGGSCLF